MIGMGAPQSNSGGMYFGYEMFLGSRFTVSFSKSSPWGFGLNLVPLVLLVALLKSMRASKSSSRWRLLRKTALLL